MVESLWAEAPVRDLHEIPSYVIREQQGPRYRPERSMFRRTLRELRNSYRPTLKQRLSEAWRVKATGPVIPLAAEADEPFGVVRLRYETTLRAPQRLPIAWLAGAAMLVGGIGLGWWFGSHATHAPIAAPAPAVQAAKPVAKAAAPVVPKPTKRTATETYTVQKGDTLASLATRFKLNPHTLRAANNLPLLTPLRVGQTLIVPPVDGFYHSMRSGETIGGLAGRYGLSPALILSYNPTVSPTHMHVGQQVFVPGVAAFQQGGHAPFRGYRTSFERRLAASRSLIGLFGNRVGQLLMPVKGQVSSPFGVRGNSFHPGVDICNVIGTPIHCAKAGTVIWAGWMGGYGKAIDVDNGGGVVTRYGHCSKLLVHVGEMVTEGQVIAKMGETGEATGPHLHFEVRIQDRAVNPTPFF